MSDLPWLSWSTIGWSLHLFLALTVSVRVIMKRPPTGVALAWLLLIHGAPGIGVVLYLLIGERRIGRQRFQRMQSVRTDFRKIADEAIRQGLTDIDWSRLEPAAKSLSRLGRSIVGAPTVRGSSLTLYSSTDEILQSIAADIDAAKTSVLIEFYIWSEGGHADEVLEAVIRAAERGVKCCVLVDALGSHPWWRSKQPDRLRQAGVELRKALPVGLFRTLFDRTDLRLHRKIVVVDGHVAWTGSLNMVDPRYFKQDAGVGQWIDAMVRAQGSVVVPLAATMIGDWMLETGDPLKELIERHQLKMVEEQGEVDLQVVPSGPGEGKDGLLQMILTLINTACEELVLTTPYLIPDDSLLHALRGAAGRGVNVKLIVPERVDSFMTRYASRSYFDDLLDAGVQLYLYRDGLLHTKSITVDGKLAMFGTVNLDMRSLFLNYEVALFIYNSEFTKLLRELQGQYLSDSDEVNREEWGERSFHDRFLENTLRLMSPLL